MIGIDIVETHSQTMSASGLTHDGPREAEHRGAWRSATAGTGDGTDGAKRRAGRGCGRRESSRWPEDLWQRHTVCKLILLKRFYLKFTWLADTV